MIVLKGRTQEGVNDDEGDDAYESSGWVPKRAM